MTEAPSGLAIRPGIRLAATAFFLFGATFSYGQRNIPYFAELDSAGNSMMRMHLDEAEALANNFIARHPENPSGYMFRAVVLGWRFFFTPEESDTRQLQKELKQAGKDCRRFAQKYRKQDKTRLEGTTCLGMSYGLEALLAMLDGRYLVMAPLALKAWDFLQEAASIEPGYYDIYFGLGLYRYFTAVLPTVVRMLAVVYGFEGDREQGLADLRLAMDRGLYTGDGAKVMLMNMYSYLEAPDSSILSLATDLRRRFPDNPLIHWRYGDILLRLKHYGQAAETFREVARGIENDRPYYRNRMFTRYSFDFRLALCNQRLGRSREALKYFESVLAADKVKPEWVVPLSHLHAAELKLAAGETGAAREHLKKTLKLDDTRGSHRRAKALLKHMEK